MQMTFTPNNNNEKYKLRNVYRNIEGKSHSYRTLGVARGASDNDKRQLIRALEEIIKSVNTRDFGLDIVIARNLEDRPGRKIWY